MPKLNITFHYGSLADPLAEQAKKQGFTLKNSSGEECAAFRNYAEKEVQP